MQPLLWLISVLPLLIVAGLVALMLHRRKQRLDLEIGEATLTRSFWGSMSRKAPRQGRISPLHRNKPRSLSPPRWAFWRRGNLHTQSTNTTPESPKRLYTATTTNSHTTQVEVGCAVAGKRVQAQQAQIMRVPSMPMPSKAWLSENYAKSGSIPLLVEENGSDVAVPQFVVHPKTRPCVEQEGKVQYVVSKAAPVERQAEPYLAQRSVATLIIGPPVQRLEYPLLPGPPNRPPPSPPSKAVCKDLVHETGRWSIVSDELSYALLKQTHDCLERLSAAPDTASQLSTERRARCDALLYHYRPFSDAGSAACEASRSRHSSTPPSSYSSPDSETTVKDDVQFDFGILSQDAPVISGEPPDDAGDERCNNQPEGDEGVHLVDDNYLRLTTISEAPSTLTNETGQPWYRWY